MVCFCPQRNAGIRAKRKTGAVFPTLSFIWHYESRNDEDDSLVDGDVSRKSGGIRDDDHDYGSDGDELLDAVLQKHSCGNHLVFASVRRKPGGRIPERDIDSHLDKRAGQMESSFSQGCCDALVMDSGILDDVWDHLRLYCIFLG